MCLCYQAKWAQCVLQLMMTWIRVETYMEACACVIKPKEPSAYCSWWWLELELKRTWRHVLVLSSQRSPVRTAADVNCVACILWLQQKSVKSLVLVCLYFFLFYILFFFRNLFRILLFFFLIILQKYFILSLFKI